MALELVLAASIITPSRGVEVLCIWISTTFGDGKFHLLGCFACTNKLRNLETLVIYACLESVWKGE